MADSAPILLDVSRLVWRRWGGRHLTGIDRVCLAYLHHFGPRAQAVVQHPRFRRVLGVQASAQLFATLDTSAGFRTALVRGFLRHAAGLAPPGRRDGRLYFNIGHTGLDRPAFSDWVRQAGVRPVYLVHDLIPITHPEYCRPGETERHRTRMRTALDTGVGIIGNSQATLDALAAFAAREGMPTPPLLAAWLGSTPKLPPAEANAPTGRPTFVVLGTIEGRKNHLLLLNIWTQLVARLGDEAPRLLVIGQRGWECEQVLDMLDRSVALRGHVVELGDCSDAEVARHVASARALLFPSMIEGFGLPLVEALGAGIPVIASDLAVFREIGGGIPDLLDPLDGLGWMRAILDYADENGSGRPAQLARLKDYRPPRWDAHLAAVDAWLRTL